MLILHLPHHHTRQPHPRSDSPAEPLPTATTFAPHQSMQVAFVAPAGANCLPGTGRGFDRPLSSAVICGKNGKRSGKKNGKPPGKKLNHTHQPQHQPHPEKLHARPDRSQRQNRNPGKNGKKTGNDSGNHITLVPAAGTRKAPLFQHSPQMWRTQNEYRGKNGKEIGNTSGNKLGKTLSRHTSPNCPPGPCPPITARLARVNNEFSTSHRRNKDE